LSIGHECMCIRGYCLARDILSDPVRIVQGEVGEVSLLMLFVHMNIARSFKANQDVMQIVHIFSNGSNKWTWLLSKLVEFTVCTYRSDSIHRCVSMVAFQ
jgi:hypothetical protein